MAVGWRDLLAKLWPWRRYGPAAAPAVTPPGPTVFVNATAEIRFADGTAWTAMQDATAETRFADGTEHTTFTNQTARTRFIAN